MTRIVSRLGNCIDSVPNVSLYACPHHRGVPHTFHVSLQVVNRVTAAEERLDCSYPNPVSMQVVDLTTAAQECLD